MYKNLRKILLAENKGYFIKKTYDSRVISKTEVKPPLKRILPKYLEIINDDSILKFSNNTGKSSFYINEAFPKLKKL